MISLSHIRPNLFVILRLANTEGVSFKFHHKDEVYIMTIEPTNEKYKQTRRPPVRIKKGATRLISSECKCGAIIINGLCSNKQCTINQWSTQSIPS